jgi:hypothetical protein
MNRNLSLLGVVAVSLLLPACATVTRGTSQKFKIESSPSEAQVSLSTGQNCVTPCKLKLKRKPGFVATFKKDGYQTQDVTVESKLGGGGLVAGAGNVLLGGVIGGIVDGTNGSMNNLSPSPLMVTLLPAAPVQAAVDAAPAAAPVEPVAIASNGEASAAAAPASAEAAAPTVQ